MAERNAAIPLILRENTMAIDSQPLKRTGSKLKASSGWFAAGISFKRGLTMLSDGAFKLFAHVSLEADRATGRYDATQTELARALGKSRRIIGKYIAELERKGVCTVRSGRNQYDRNTFEILDDYWPYYRDGYQERSQKSEYVVRVRRTFLSLECTKGSFGPSDERFADELEKRGIPIVTIEDALVLAAVRKYISWLNNGPSEPIASLNYVKPVIAEIQQQPWPAEYREHFREKLIQYVKLWQRTGKEGGNQSMGSREIVDPGPF
jgi:hypothetical protein